MTENQPQNKNKWQAVQNQAADKSGLAVVVADENSPAVSKSNNNSMCEILYNSEEFAPECDKYCGKAFRIAAEAGKTIGYKCYAGLNCLAVPIEAERKQFVVITGRTFLKADDYRSATERVISGDWRQFEAGKFFENVFLSGSPRDLETLAKRFENLSDGARESLLQWSVEISRAGNVNAETQTKDAPEIDNAPKIENSESIKHLTEETKSTSLESGKNDRKIDETAIESAAWRLLIGSLLNSNYKEARVTVLKFLARQYGIFDSAWLERRENNFAVVFANGFFKDQPTQISLRADDERLLEAVRKESSLELRERQAGGEDVHAQTIRLFPVAIGGEIQSALVIGDRIADENTKRHIARFCRTIASELEILRLREELFRRSGLAHAVQRFNESVKEVDTESFWSNLTQICAELMRAGRASLLVFNEKSDTLVAKAATGERAAIIESENKTLGDRVARKVLQNGVPLVVENVETVGLKAAPAERNYKSNSFISYPIMIGGRRIGVLNITEKTGGENYTDSDLEMLNAIAPQLAVMIDRAGLKHKAGEFEQLSVTDALTGLLNRRYLEERLAEEIKRSNRHGFPMSFMMIDVDDFKSYNDNFSHPEGDKALQIVAQTLKETLRGADVAARYGGEEFSILLPQTTSEEAQTIAERIREKIESTEFPKRKVTISVGIATCSNLICTPQAIVSAADAALYEAKRKGKNNVQVYESLELNLTAEAQVKKRDI